MSPYVKHFPVMSNEVVNYVSKNKEGVYLDCTFGAGGHSRMLLNALGKNARVIAIDVDDEAIRIGRELENEDSRFEIHKENFKNIADLCKKLNLKDVDGVIFDLGTSTMQLSNPDRGFSYTHDDCYLDMRMDNSLTTTAADILNEYKRDELSIMFKRYGDIKNPSKLVNLILQCRKQGDGIHYTSEFKNLIARAFPVLTIKIVSQCFQALRIEVNNEIGVFSKALDSLDEFVKKEGIVCIITFHSLEESTFHDWKRRYCDDIEILDYPEDRPNKFTMLTTGYVSPESPEIFRNWGSRSAKLWVVQKN